MAYYFPHVPLLYIECSNFSYKYHYNWSVHKKVDRTFMYKKHSFEKSPPKVLVCIFCHKSKCISPIYMKISLVTLIHIRKHWWKNHKDRIRSLLFVPVWSSLSRGNLIFRNFRLYLWYAFIVINLKLLLLYTSNFRKLYPTT